MGISLQDRHFKIFLANLVGFGSPWIFFRWTENALKSPEYVQVLQAITLCLLLLCNKRTLSYPDWKLHSSQVRAFWECLSFIWNFSFALSLKNTFLFKSLQTWHWNPSLTTFFLILTQPFWGGYLGMLVTFVSTLMTSFNIDFFLLFLS